MSIAAQIIEVGLRLVEAGVTDGTTGNVSAREGRGFLITPTSRDYRLLAAADLVRVDLASGHASGRWRPSSEWQLHAEVYRAREDVGAVVHHHAPWSSAVAVAGRTIPVLVDEAADIGPIPTTPYAPSASPELARIVSEAIAQGYNAVLLANHGVVAVGCGVVEALRRALEVEKVAMMFIAAELIGGARPLDSAAMIRSREFFSGYRAEQTEFPAGLRLSAPAVKDVHLRDLMAYSVHAGLTFVSLLQSFILKRLLRQM